MIVDPIRPLRRAGGGWRSHDGHWTFLRHHSDPPPKRWFAYWKDEGDPANAGEGHTTLRDAIAWARRQS